MIAAVILAAGASTRLGRPKQLLRYEGDSLLRRAANCAIAAGCRPIIVVVGALADAMQAEVEGLPVEVARNDDWQEGMSASIRTGVEALQEYDPGPRAVVLMTCDQSRLTAGVLRSLCDKFDGVVGRMVACAYADTVGVPALFERSRFEEMLALQGAGGARSVLQAHPAAVVQVPWSEGIIDIDRLEDIQR